jgi:hypothetical protein
MGAKASSGRGGASSSRGGGAPQHGPAGSAFSVEGRYGPELIGYISHHLLAGATLVPISAQLELTLPLSAQRKLTVSPM